MSERVPIAIDTNILLRHLMHDHPDHSPRATELLLSVGRGDQKVFCPATVIFEAIHLLHGRAKIPRSDAATSISDLVGMQHFEMEREPIILDALQFWVEQPALDFADCYHLALTSALGIDAIYTFDKKMDRYPGVSRLEP